MKTRFCPSPSALECQNAQVELKTGETYRGELAEAEDNWNCQIKNVSATARVRSEPRVLVAFGDLAAN